MGWKLFDLSRITELRSVNEHFTHRRDYGPSDIVRVYCQV
jgi:hypothetical protein